MIGRAGAALAICTLAAAAMSACGGGEASTRATVPIRFSQFERDVVVARAGVPVTITLRNDDPIEHEWIVGPDAVHARHRTGTEPSHDERPTEVTVPALETRTTTVTFEAPGTYAYICHLPGHEDYGMTGVLRVLAN